MKIAFSCLSIVLAIFLEVAIVHAPLTLLTIILCGIFLKKQWLFFIALVAGIVLDSLLFRVLGIDSLLFVLILGVIFLYSRKFEIDSFPFFLLFSFLAGTIAILLFGGAYVVQIMIILFLGSFAFAIKIICGKKRESGYSVIH